MRKKIALLTLMCTIASATLPAMAAISVSGITDVDADSTPIQANILQRMTVEDAVPVQVALVSSCKDPWYYWSLIEEFACGWSGQGWFN